MSSSPPPTSASPSSHSSSNSSSLEVAKHENTNVGDNTPALSRLNALLRQVLRVTTTDGRIFIGTFAGTDKPLNIILVNADEYRIGQQGDGRYVGQVMFPWKMVTKVEAHTKGSKSRSYYDESMYF